MPADFRFGFAFVGLTVALVKGRFKFILGCWRRAASSAGMVGIRSRLMDGNGLVLLVAIVWSWSLEWTPAMYGVMLEAIFRGVER